MSLQNSIVSKNNKQTLTVWDKLGEDFYNAVCHYRRTPPSSPPDIWWSSSGSSDVDETSPHTHHKVITKLDFDSCIVQSPYSLHKSRTHMIHNVISKNQSLHDSSSVNELKWSVQEISSDITELCTTDDKCNVNISINAQGNDKQDIIQNSPVSVSQNFMNDLKDTSPVIGNKNEPLHGKKLKRNKKRRKVVSCNEQTTSLSPIIGLGKLKMNRSCLSNTEIEENVVEVVTTDDTSQDMDIKSPVIQHYKQCKGKNSSNLKIENSEIKTEVDANAVISGNKDKIPEISSPILGLSVEKKMKCKRRKVAKRQKDNLLDGNVKLDCDSKLVKICKNLFSEDCNDIPDNGVDSLKVIGSNVINSGKSDLENKRKLLKRYEDESLNENMNFWSNSDEIKMYKSHCREVFNAENASNEDRVVNSNDIKNRRKSDIESVDDGVSCDSPIESSLIKVGVEIVRNKVENEYVKSAENCDEHEILMNWSRTDCCNYYDLNMSINTDSLVQESKASEFTIVAEEHSIEDRGNDVNVSNTDLEIEVVTSQEVIQESGEDQLARMSVPSSCEMNMISSCSTPPSQKTEACKSDEEYMDSAKKKKKRIKLNRSGFAARLKKLISRKESSKHMWKYETSLMKPMPSLSKGIILNIISVWEEYSHTLLHCTIASGKFISPQSSEMDDGESNKNFKLVVVLESLPSLKLKPQSCIQVYPPWQTLNILDLKLTMIFGVTWIEEVQEILKEYKNLEVFLKPQEVIETTVYSSFCKCLEVKNSETKCQFQFPHHGLEFLEFLLSLNIPRGVTCDIKSECVEKCKWSIREAGTIAEAVANQGCLLTGDIWLQLCVLNIFRFKSRNQASSRNNEKEVFNTSWSILGCDSAGECCEIVLGPAASEVDTMQSWSKVTTRQAVGHFFKFTRFNIVKRFHKNKNAGFWALIKRFSLQREERKEKQSEQFLGSVEVEQDHPVNAHKSEESETQSKKNLCVKNEIGECQLFAYVLAPGTETWRMEILECSRAVCLPQSKIYNLADALLKDGGGIGRYTYLTKLIWAAENHLYVSDMSLDNCTTQNYIRISITSSCFLPSEIISKKADVILLQDLILENGIASADKFSWLVNVSNAMQREDTYYCPQITDEDIDLLRNLQITPPHLNHSSANNDLVSLKGTVMCVDEETAFSWPVCGTCDNEFLIEVTCGQYLCQRCDSSQTCTRMSLEVFVKCQEISDTCKIKVKMEQNSIMKLLPSSQDNTEGYQLSSVLNQTVGPLLCIVVKTAANSFFLNEINI